MKAPGNCRNIDEIRAEIDRIDKNIISALAERLTYVKEAAKYKLDIEDINAPDRHKVMLKQRTELAKEFNLDIELVEKVYDILLDYYKLKQFDIWKEM